MGRKSKSKYRSNFTNQEWLELIGQWEESGLTQTEFCVSQRICPKTFSAKKRKLAPEAAETPWVEAVIVPADIPAASPPAEGADSARPPWEPPPIVVRAGAFGVECRPGFDARLLREVCEALACRA